MHRLSKQFQFNFIKDILHTYSNDSGILKNSYPFQIHLNGKTLSLWVNKIHDSGHGRTNEDECRIQINAQQLHSTVSQLLIFLGYNASLDVFSIWNPDLIVSHRNSTTFSLYSRLSKLSDASKNGISLYYFNSRLLDEQTFCLNFKSEFLGVVLDNLDVIWKLKETQLIDILNYSSYDFVVVDRSHIDNRDSSKIVVLRRQFKRNPEFRREIIKVYQNHCCLCGIQLGIVEAAHIVPHAHPNSSDNVDNGLALCPNHHSLFDTGLVGISEDYKLLVNSNRAEYLKQRHLIEGIDEINRLEWSSIRLPDKPQFYPSASNLALGNRIRGVILD